MDDDWGYPHDLLETSIFLQALVGLLGSAMTPGEAAGRHLQTRKRVRQHKPHGISWPGRD